VPSFTQVITSWRGCSVSPGSSAALGGINRHQSSHAPSDNMLSISPSLHSYLLFFPIFSLSISFSKPLPSLLPFIYFWDIYLISSFSLSLSPSLSSPSMHLLLQPFLPLHPTHTPRPLLLSFHSLRKSHSLIWDMLDLVSLKATLLTHCLPLLNTAHDLKQFHHSLSFLHWNAVRQGDFLLPHGLLMLIVHLTLHLLDRHPRLPPPVLPPPLLEQKCLIYTDRVASVM